MRLTIAAPHHTRGFLPAGFPLMQKKAQGIAALG